MRHLPSKSGSIFDMPPAWKSLRSAGYVKSKGKGYGLLRGHLALVRRYSLSFVTAQVAHLQPSTILCEKLKTKNGADTLPIVRRSHTETALRRKKISRHIGRLLKKFSTLMTVQLCVVPSLIESTTSFCAQVTHTSMYHCFVHGAYNWRWLISKNQSVKLHF